MIASVAAEPGWAAAQLAYLGVLGVLGYTAARLIHDQLDLLTNLSVSFPLGVGMVTWSLFLLSWAGVPLTQATLVTLIVGLTAIEIALLRWRSRPLSRQQRLTVGLADKVFFAFLITTMVAAAYFAVARSVGSYDVLAGWSLKGYGIARDGSVLAGARWGMWGLAYPLNNHLVFGTFSLLGGDFGPLSKLAYPLFFGSISLGLYAFWRRNGVSGLLRFAGGLFLITNPILLLHATMGYANLPFVSYLIPGMLLALEGLREADSRVLWLSGLLLALAAWTRAEGIGYLLLVLAVLALVVLLSRWRDRARLLGRLVIPIVVIALPWFAFGWTSVENSHLGTAMGGVLPRLREGQFNLAQLYLIPRLFLDRGLHPENFGLFIPFGLVTILVGIAVLVRQRTPYWWGFWGLTVVSVISPVGLFYVRSFTRMEDFKALLIRSFDRAFFPGLFMVVALGILASSRLLSGSTSTAAAANDPESAS